MEGQQFGESRKGKIRGEEERENKIKSILQVTQSARSWFGTGKVAFI